MEVIDQPVAPIYMDTDGVMINSRDNEKRMEGKVAVVWSKGELVKSDTYALTDKRYMGSFKDPERFYWDMTIDKVRSKRKLYHLNKLREYIKRNRDGMWYKEAREKGISIGSGSADKAGDILICRRMKLRGMRWCREKADNVLNICILVLNGE